jgi:hypothetical protein
VRIAGGNSQSNLSERTMIAAAKLGAC